jgi:FkbH-like protein
MLTVEKERIYSALSTYQKVQPVKCVIWDLDNTVWHGVLAENDDLVLKEGIVDIIVALDKKGVLQSIASKNNYDDAINKLEQFGLLDYFLYPQINWNAKSSSVELICKNLNIGIDTFLFIDDQPFELEEVKLAHPQVEIFDAADYQLLMGFPRIQSVVVADDAARRRIRYQEDMKRHRSEEDFVGTPEAFLASLNMVFAISKAVPEDLLRAEELTLRTNQLNSTGITYSADELFEFMHSEKHELLICELTDKYGSYGKIGLTLIEKQESFDVVKLLLMSCRTAARGVGSVLLSYLMRQAKSRGNSLRAEFKRTDRNRQMLVTYQFSGFIEQSRDGEGNILFEHDLSDIREYPDYIKVLHP